MTGGRRLLSNAILLAILGGQAVAIVADRELWPFSNYPMFSRPLGATDARFWLCGVLEDGTEVPLRRRSAFHPFRLAQLEGALERMDGAQLAVAARDLLLRYEARRAGGLHDGPPLAAMRIYRVVWATAAPAAHGPLARELVAEAR